MYVFAGRDGDGSSRSTEKSEIGAEGISANQSHQYLWRAEFKKCRRGPWSAVIQLLQKP